MASDRIAEERMGKMKKIEFIASLPPIQSLINIDGQGNSARIKLDIPASELLKVIELQRYNGESFRATIKYRDFD